MKIIFIIIVLCVSFSAQAVLAADKMMTIKGIVSVGTLDSSIDTSDDKGYVFLTDSEVGNKIFKVCQADDLCQVTGLIGDGYINSVVTVKKMSKPFITIPAVDKKDNNDKSKKKEIELKGVVLFGHDAGGGNYWIDGGKGKQYTLIYVWAIDDKLQDTLGQLADTKTKVIVKGTLSVFKDGSTSFDNSEPIEIFK